MLGTLGSHMIDFARWYVGDLAQISGHVTSFVERKGPEGGVPFTSANDSALIAIEFAEGAQGTICVSGASPILRNAEMTSRSGSMATPAHWNSTSTSPARGYAGFKR
jgi:predicted dehydrogenase